MAREWIDAGEAAEIGTALADQLALQTVSRPDTRGESQAVQEFLQRADHRIRTLRLNFFKKAKVAHCFKWRLLERGVAKEIADEVTWKLVLHLFLKQAGRSPLQNSPAVPKARRSSRNAQYLLAQGDKCFARGAYAEAIGFYRDLVRLTPRHADALNNLGATLCRLGRFQEAEDHFKEALRKRPDYPEAHGNLGTLYQWQGLSAKAEHSLQRALQLKPSYVDARSSLGAALVSLGRVHDAKLHFEKVLKTAPRHAQALLGMGRVAAMEGRFDEAGALFTRALEVKPRMPDAWAALAGIRKMTSSDGAWLEGAEKIAASDITPLEEAYVRFAIGKYCDDVGDFERAFRSYKRANALLKTLAKPYDREARASFVDDLIRAYPERIFSRIEAGGCDSMRPIFIVGMMRSGTSLAHQIVSSHPAVKGAGELTFWNDALFKHESDMRRAPLDGSVRKKLADAYLRVLAGVSVDAQRIVDKAPVNSDYLGVIHSIFPNARIIYMQRSPIDTCLSSYFQNLSPALNFTMDLSDLAHYYREHQRLSAHWHAVLPPGTILDVPYAELVANQERWTRKILDFLGLEWDNSCLHFHEAKRPVATASHWQVRQRMYTSSVERWRNYQRFIRPLLALEKGLYS